MDWEALKRQATKVRAGAASAVKDLVMTEIENKTRSATADTSWRVSGSELEDIARATFHRDEYQLVMCILWQRLASRRWRCAFKGLELLRFLCLHGSSRVVDQARDAINHLQSLENFGYVDPRTGRDEGQNVRNKAKALVDLLQDDIRLEEERQKSKTLRGKMGGARDRKANSQTDDYQPRRTSQSTGRQDHENNHHADTRDNDTMPPDLDSILGLSDTHEAGAVVPVSGNEISLIDGSDDDDFDPRGSINGLGVGTSMNSSDIDIWSQQVPALEAPPPSSVAVMPAAAAAKPLQANSVSSQVFDQAVQQSPQIADSRAHPGTAMFMQNLTSGLANSTVTEKTASLMASNLPSGSIKPLAGEMLSQPNLGSASERMKSMATSTIAPAVSVMVSSGVSPAVAAQVADDDLFGGLVDLKNLTMNKPKTVEE